MRSLLFLLLLLSMAGKRAFADASSDFENRANDLIKNAQGLSDTDRLHKLFDANWEYTMKTAPEFATTVGYPGQNDRWSDASETAINRAKKIDKINLDAIKAIDRAKLNGDDQISYDLYRRNAEFAVEGDRFPFELMPITQLNGVQQNAAQIIAQTSFKTTRDYEDLVARLNALPTLIDQNIALLERGLAQKITPPQITLRDVPKQVENLLIKNPMESPMLAPFKQMPEQIPAVDQQRLKRAASEAFTNKVEPAFNKLRDFLVTKYLPGARTTTGFNALPNGDRWYAYAARLQTTTEKAPSEIHQLGLGEVKRIRSEMDKVIQQTGFKGTFTEFCDYLRKDPKFYYRDGESLLAGYRDIGKRIDPELVKFFGHLPQLPWGIKGVPAYAAESQTAAYYEQGSLKSGRPGWFFANTSRLNTRPKWGMETLTLHEAVPGHHLQISIAQEMENLPEFRKNGFYVAYTEGWALYAESLGYEMGFFKDPYQNFGHLSDEMWRAVRLVVDTGLHSMNWSRDQAIDYFMSNTPSSKEDITVEIDRYIVWPGQALGYKIGQLKIRELRNHAQSQLRQKFDLRGFHDELLKNGALPMSVLETHIKEWIAKKKSV